MEKQVLYIAGGAVGVSAAFVAFRMYVRNVVSKKIFAQYQADPSMGPILVSAAMNEVVVKVEEGAVRRSCEILATDMVRILSLQIPTEESVELYIKGRLGSLLGVSGEDLNKLIAAGMSAQDKLSEYQF
jgi:hypothetical protein